MTNQDGVGSRSAAETRKASGDGPGVGRGGRMSRQRKRDAVLRLLRGEHLETVSRALGVTAATLTGWQEAFLAAGEASLATRPADGEELESGRLKARLGEMLLERGLLEAKIATLEGKRPLDRRRSRR
jgi:transposase